MTECFHLTATLDPAMATSEHSSMLLRLVSLMHRRGVNVRSVTYVTNGPPSFESEFATSRDRAVTLASGVRGLVGVVGVAIEDLAGSRIPLLSEGATPADHGCVCDVDPVAHRFDEQSRGS